MTTEQRAPDKAAADALLTAQMMIGGITKTSGSTVNGSLSPPKTSCAASSSVSPNPAASNFLPRDQV